MLQALLEPAGVAIAFVENGADAVETLARSSFDLVLMDVNMPVMDGVSALKAIRALRGRQAGTPVHMVTANVFEEDVRRYLAAGADGDAQEADRRAELFRALVAQVSASRGQPEVNAA